MFDSGNPLRQLRSSRFVCNPREASFVSDACNAMPLKTPAQIHQHAVTDTGRQSISIIHIIQSAS